MMIKYFLRRLIGIAMIIALFSTFIFILLRIPTLKEVKIHGIQNLTVDDIKKIGKLQIGEAFFRIKTNEIQRRLMSDLRIERAVVQRELPNSFKITIKERQPIAIIEGYYGYLVLDETGTVIDVVKDMESSPIVPVITGVKVYGTYIEDRIDNENLKSALNFLQNLSGQSRSLISELSISDNGYINAFTSSEPSIQIRVGSSEQLEEKIKKIETFLYDNRKSFQDIEYVDFSYTTPFLKIRK